MSENADPDLDRSVARIDRLNAEATQLQRQGLYKEAFGRVLHACVLALQSVGEKHAATATSLGNLGVLFYHLGQYEAAEIFLKRALEINRQARGEKDPHYATDLNNLGALQKRMGNYAAAEALYRQSL